MEDWKYEQNAIETVTRNSFKLMDLLLRDHVARLLKFMTKFPGDADYLAMHGAAAAELSQWLGAYLPYRAARGVYKARTQTFYELLEALPGKLDDWDIDIQAAGGPAKPFKAGKPAYTELFPQGRTPFTSGAVDQRVAAVETLVLSLTPHAALTDVRTSVTSAANELTTARSNQQGEEGGTEQDSGNLETRRIAAAGTMFRNIGRGMTKYGPGPLTGKLFDLSFIRDGATPPPDDAPPAPGDFFVSAVGGAETDVLSTWGGVPAVDGYRLYRRLPGETAWTMMAEVPAPATQFQATGQPAGVEMEWAVSAFSGPLEGPRSAPDTITL